MSILSGEFSIGTEIEIITLVHSSRRYYRKLFPENDATVSCYNTAPGDVRPYLTANIIFYIETTRTRLLIIYTKYYYTTILFKFTFDKKKKKNKQTALRENHRHDIDGTLCCVVARG